MYENLSDTVMTKKQKIKKKKIIGPSSFNSKILLLPLDEQIFFKNIGTFSNFIGKIFGTFLY